MLKKFKVFFLFYLFCGFGNNIFSVELDVWSSEALDDGTELEYYLRKTVDLSLGFSAVIGTYTIMRDFRDIIFKYSVGADKMQMAQIIGVFVYPVIGWLSGYFLKKYGLVKKEHQLYFFTGFYLLMMSLMLYFITSSTKGIFSGSLSSLNLFGWLSFFLIESMSPFLVGNFKSFSNTLIPIDQREMYTWRDTISRLFGVGVSYFGIKLVGSNIFSTQNSFRIYITLAMGSLILMPFLVDNLSTNIPEEKLYGFQASYEADKEIEDDYSNGYFHVMSSPYLFGIFAKLFLWGVSSALICALIIKSAVQASTNIGEFGVNIFKNSLKEHIIGSILAGTLGPLFFKSLDTSTSLRVVSVINLLLLVTGNRAPAFLPWIWPALRTFNISMQSVKDSLYTVTSKRGRYFAQSWIDNFGFKFSGGVGALIVILMRKYGCLNYNFVLDILIAIGILNYYISDFLSEEYDAAVRENRVVY